MAVTKLIAVASQGRGKTSKSGIAATIDYVCNPAKTNHGECVSGFGCNPETAAHEFEFAKITVSKTGGRQGYHLIQSFAPGESNPQQAHEIGCKLADELLQGRFQYVVSTHQDKNHIHNHIVFNSVSFIDGKKFHGAANIFNKIADISDSLCWEYGLSIVEERQAKGKSYAEHTADKQGQSWKSKLREILDDCIRRAKDWEEFLQLMREAECEIKFGKHICFRHKEQQRFTRGKTLGQRYTEDKIKSQLQGVFIDINAPQNQSGYQPNRTLVYDIENSVKAKQSEGLKHWMEIQNLKMAAMTINYLSDNNLMDYKTLSSKCDEMKSKRDLSLSRIKEVEARIKVLKSQIKDLDTFRKNKPIVDKLDSVIFKERYRRENESAFILFESARKSLKEHFPDNKFPTIKSLREEMSLLYSEKEKLYPEYYSAKDELKNLSAHKTNVDYILGKTPERESHNRSRNTHGLE